MREGSASGSCVDPQDAAVLNQKEDPFQDSAVRDVPHGVHEQVDARTHAETLGRHRSCEFDYQGSAVGCSASQLPWLELLEETPVKQDNPGQHAWPTWQLGTRSGRV